MVAGIHFSSQRGQSPCSDEKAEVCSTRSVVSRPWPASPLKLRPRQGDLSVCEDGENHILNAEDDYRKYSLSAPLVIGLASEEVEPWQRFPFLKYGYRRGGSYYECLMSLFSLHNETVNVWTTLLSVFVGLVLFADTVSNLRCSWLDFSPFMVAWIGQTLHSPLSCGYHTFLCMSPTIANRWRKLDLTFILVLNTCATYALSYFTFGLYLSLLWTAMVGFAAVLGIRRVRALQPWQQLDRRRIVSMIGLTCLGYYVPLVVRGLVALVLQGKVWPELGIALVVLGCHITGAMVYATHWPQRFFPGLFDMAGFSHNLMHILCFTAYNCAYPYLSYLYSQRTEWWATLQHAAAGEVGSATVVR
ncbi:hypothetical protein VaNZ11_006161 [Volvox africanus]|uniref:Progestin and adipoQ receptor family member 4 n=1 Tax=Volvox africanus TaxID=51714 RepID=A0ABQ5S048_9CHLO|nr:hypothetical protein VaNZ11_006161 [Volvox africanus]